MKRQLALPLFLACSCTASTFQSDMAKLENLTSQGAVIAACVIEEIVTVVSVFEGISDAAIIAAVAPVCNATPAAVANFVAVGRVHAAQKKGAWDAGSFDASKRD